MFVGTYTYNDTTKIHRQITLKAITLSALSSICLSATSGDLTRRPSTDLSADTRPPFNLSLLLPRTTYNPQTKQITLKSYVLTSNETHNLTANPLMGTLKQHSNGPLYSNTVIGTLAVMGGLLQSPPCCTQYNSPPINGQCTNFILFDVTL